MNPPVDYFFTAYFPAVLLVIGAVFYVMGQQRRVRQRPLSSSVRPKLSVAFRAIFPHGWRERRTGWMKAGFYLELFGFICAAAAFLSVFGYWVWWLLSYRSGS